MFHSQQNNLPKERAQAIVEFAIVLPILMLLLVGILEVGRMIFIYSAVNNASREAARYGSAVGLADGGVYSKFQYCSEIRNVARRSTFFMTLTDSDIDINYDDGPASVGSPFDNCPAGTTADTSITVVSGDRVTVTVRADYSPMVNLIPITSRTFTSTTSRTILGIFELGSATSTPGPATSIPTNAPTLTPTNLPTATATATATATPGVVSTLTPIACGNVTLSNINIQNKTMSTTITNPFETIPDGDISVL
jgi:Flp pilus assembly protein TadG